MTRLDAVFIRDCGPRTGTCGLLDLDGGTCTDVSPRCGAVAGQPSSSFTRSHHHAEGWLVYFPNFMSSYSCKEEKERNVRNPYAQRHDYVRSEADGAYEDVRSETDLVFRCVFLHVALF